METASEDLSEKTIFEHASQWGCITPAQHVVQQVIIISHEMLKFFNKDWRPVS